MCFQSFIIDEYNKFKEYINKGNIGDIINKYKNNNSEYIVEIMNLLQNSYIKKVKERVEDKNEFNKIKKAEYELKPKNRTIPPNETIYYYYTNIEIINEEIFNYIKDMINIQNLDKRDFLIGDNKIIMEYNMQYQHSIIIGYYTDFNFVPSILLDFKGKKYFETYFQSFINDGYDETMKGINTNQSGGFKISDGLKEMVSVYNLDIEENKEGNIQIQNLSSKPQNNNNSKNTTKENKYFEMYFQSFINDGYDKTMKGINTNKLGGFKIYDKTKEIASAYNLNQF